MLPVHQHPERSRQQGQRLPVAPDGERAGGACVDICLEIERCWSYLPLPPRLGQEHAHRPVAIGGEGSGQARGRLLGRQAADGDAADRDTMKDASVQTSRVGEGQGEEPPGQPRHDPAEAEAAEKRPACHPW